MPGCVMSGTAEQGLGAGAGPVLGAAPLLEPNSEKIRAWLVNYLGSKLGVKPSTIRLDERFSRYGLNSLGAAELLGALSGALGRPLQATLVWDYPTVDLLSRYLSGEVIEQRGSSSATLSATPTADNEPIAIVGLACRFPGASNPDKYWELLCQGVDAIREVPKERWSLDAFFDADKDAPGKMSTRWGGFLDQVDEFEPQFFGISPREAVQIDPQQRLMLELSWEALENAGVVPETLKGSRTGVFFGAMWADYARLSANSPTTIVQHSATGQDLSIIPARVSYTLGLEGPSLVLNTACSSSLVAVHLACQSLRSGESTMALAGGVNLILSPESTVTMSKFGAMAPDGRSKAFDASANGYVRGEGGGVIVLKRLSQALADKDPIYCVIRSSAVNNDGFSNGLTAPNPHAQAAVLRDAYGRGGIKAADVHYIETHGTGTILGDPIEANAIGETLGAGRADNRPLRIGSVKTNIGHLEAAAGIAGLIKVALSIKNRTLPPSLHFKTPNPHIAFERLHLKVNSELTPWPCESEPAVAGVSSFGFGGTNCHVVLGENGSRPAHLFALSAPNRTALLERVEEVETAIATSGERIEQIGARFAAEDQHPVRFAATVRSVEDLVERLKQFRAGEKSPGIAAGTVSGAAPKVAFVFPGQGSQWLGMGTSLYRRYPVFARKIDECDRAIRDAAGWSVYQELFRDKTSSRLSEIDIVQPTIFSIQVALAALWRSWGIEPDVVIGHSMGEVAAAHVSGILSVEDAVKILCARTRLMKRMSGGGAMALVELSEEALADALASFGGGIGIAAYNSPGSHIVGGHPDAMEPLLFEIEKMGVFARKVRVDVASHTGQMESLRDELATALGDIQPRSAIIPMLSTVTNAFVKGEECGPDYWVRNLRQPVRFSQSVDALLRAGYSCFLEISPHPILTSDIEKNIQHVAKPNARALSSLRREENEEECLLDTLGQLWAMGRSVSLPATSRLGQTESESPMPVLLSAKTRESLQELAKGYVGTLSEPGVSLADVSATSCLRRSHLSERAAVVGSTREEVVEALRALSLGQTSARLVTGRDDDDRSPLVFVFSGQGTQSWNMGRGLLPSEPVFARSIRQTDRELQTLVDWSLVEELSRSEGESKLGETEYAQPALFAIQLALAELLASWGVKPELVIGHSVGEIAAACVAEILSHEDAVRLVVHRARIMQRVTGKGAMAAVGLSRSETEKLVAESGQQLDFAACNGPRSCVISGDVAGIELVMSQLQGAGIYSKKLPVNCAFHSRQLDIFRDELVDVFAGVRPGAGTIPMLSTVTGRQATGSDLDAKYWAENVRRPVLLEAAVGAAIESGASKFIEVGAHPALGTSIEETLKERGKAGAAISTLRKGRDDRSQMLLAASALHIAGRRVEWGAIVRAGHATRLPTYRWERARYWVDVPPVLVARVPASHGLAGRKLRLSPLSNERIFENALTVLLRSILVEHKIADEPLFPAMGYIELIRAALELKPTQAVEVRDVALGQRLVLNGDERRVVQLFLSPQGEGFQCKVVSFAEGDVEPDVTQHFEGTLQLRGGTNPEGAAVALSGAAVGVDEIAGPAFYETISAAAFQYGPTFQQVKNLRVTDGATEVELQALKALQPLQQSDELLRIARFDGCVQAALALATGEATMVPAGWENAWCSGATAQPHRGYVSVKSQAPGKMVVDVTVRDDGGHVLLHINGLRFLSIEKKAKANAPMSSLWTPAWREQPRPGASLSRAGTWVIFGSQEGLAIPIANQLQRAGQAVRIISRQGHPCEKGGVTMLVEPSAEVERWASLCSQSETPLAGMVFVAEDNGDAVNDSLFGGLQRALTATQALVVGMSGRTRPKLRFITQGLHAERPPHRWENAAIEGLAAVVASEHPELHTKTIDVDPLVPDVDELASEVLSDDEEPRVALKKGRRLVLRLEDASSGHDAKILQLGNGTLDGIRWGAHEPAQPGPNEVAISVRATGVNFRDVLTALGMVAGTSSDLGRECAGVVSAVGAGVSDVRVGDDVVAVGCGFYATDVVVPVTNVAKKPKAWTYREAASLPLAYLTVYCGLLDLAQLTDKDTILIHSAAGGVGLAAVHVAMQRGAKIIATVGSDEKCEFLRALGVETILNSRTLDFADEVLQRTNGKGVDVVLNSLNREFTDASVRALSETGRFVEIGKIGAWTQQEFLQRKPNAKYFHFDLGEVIRDQPETCKRWLDSLVASPENVAIGRLRSFPYDKIASAFSQMSVGKHIGKFVVSYPCGADDDAREGLRDDATYLITGAFGGIGRQLTEYLADQGAKSLVLAGRTVDAHWVDELRNRGVNVQVAALDIANDEEVAQLMRSMSHLPPLRGVVHAAGVIDDGALTNLSWQRFEAVLRPKAVGAWNLHRSTQNLNLDFFVLFSSIAPIVGTPGQANYAAANAAMDALARYRGAQGLPATSINWGPWAEAGMAAASSKRQSLERLGLGFIQPATGLDLLRRILANVIVPQMSAVTIAKPTTSWERLIGKVSEPSSRTTSDTVKVQAAEVLKEKLLGISEERRLVELQRIATEKASEVLQLPPTRIGLRVPLPEAGLDSLLAVEFKNKLELVIGQPLPATLIWGYPSIAELAPFLGEKLGVIASKQDVQTAASKETEPGDGLELADILALTSSLSDEALAGLTGEDRE